MIPPGQVGSIHAKLKTDKFNGEVGRGITVHTNDPNHPKLFLTVRANVVASVELFPRDTMRLSNRDVRHVRATVLVRRAPNEVGELAMTGLESDVPWLKVSARRVALPEPGEGGRPTARPGDWLLEAELAGIEDYGRQQANIRFRTGLTIQPEVVIPVVADLKPPVTLSANPLRLPPSAAAGDSPDTVVLVSVRRDLDAADLRVEAEPQTIEVDLEPSGRNYKLHVKWPAADRSAGRITFHVGGESYGLPVVTGAP